jgi:hypothetical protein
MQYHYETTIEELNVGEMYFFDADVAIVYDISPPEKRTYDYPGAPAEAEYQDVILQEVTIYNNSGDIVCEKAPTEFVAAILKKRIEEFLDEHRDQYAEYALEEWAQDYEDQRSAAEEARWEAKREMELMDKYGRPYEELDEQGGWF